MRKTYFYFLTYLLMHLSSFSSDTYAFDLTAPVKKNSSQKTNLTIDDVRPPLMINNRMIDFPTVQVFGVASPGSGVIIAEKDNEYFILTAAHVVKGTGKNEYIEVMTPDENYHESRILLMSNKLDIALISISSTNKYYPAFIDSNTFPEADQRTTVIGYALATQEAREGTRRKSPGEVMTTIKQPKDGYDFMYNNATNRGMSGGPVYAKYRTGMLNNPESWASKDVKPENCQANWFFVAPLLGIHGRGEGYHSGGKSGANLGISIQTALAEVAPALIEKGITSLPKEPQTLLFKEGCPLYKESGGV